MEDRLWPTMAMMEDYWTAVSQKKARRVQFDEDGIRVWWTARSFTFQEYPQCHIANCGLCGRLSANRRLISAGDYDFQTGLSLDLRLCIGCYSKLDRYNRRIAEAEENKTIINRLERFARHAETKHDRLFASRALEDLGRRDIGPDRPAASQRSGQDRGADQHEPADRGTDRPHQRAGEPARA